MLLLISSSLPRQARLVVDVPSGGLQHIRVCCLLNLLEGVVSCHPTPDGDGNGVITAAAATDSSSLSLSQSDQHQHQ
jgi:hypothetical protein